MTTPEPSLPLPRDARLQRYADGVLDGLEGWAAYQRAFPECRTKQSAHTGHKRAGKRLDVKAYMQAVRNKAAGGAVASVQAKRELLFRVMFTPLLSIDPNDPNRKNGDLIKKYKRTVSETGETEEIEKLCPLRAIEIDNRLSGDDHESSMMGDFMRALCNLKDNATTLPDDRM